MFAGISYSYNAGGLLFDPSLPVEDARISAHIPSVSAGASFGVLGRSSQALVVLPYVVADITGKLAGADQFRYRSGLADSVLRFAINLRGAPALHRKEFAARRPRTVIGTSLTAYAPVGQYDPNVVINIGANRWAFKPELGISTPWRNWSLEGAIGAWFYTKNPNFYGPSVRKQNPLGSIQAHLVRILPRRQWLAVDATFFTGGRTEVNGVDKSDYQGNSRIGLTYGIPVGPRQAIRISFFEGVTARIGSKIRSVGVAYQWAWSAVQ